MRKMVLTIAVIVALAAGAEAWAQQKIDQRRPAATDAVVSIHNVAGSVVVTGWDRPEVAVAGTAEEGVEAVDVTGGPGRVDIEVKLRKQSNHDSAQLEVKVPKGGKVEVNAVSADVSVSGVAGGAKLESVSGGVKATGPVGSLRAESVSGKVEVENGSGTVSASSVSGSVAVQGGTLDDCHIKNVSGHVTFDGGLTANGSLSVEGVSSQIELTLPANLAAEFALESFSGDIRSAFGDGKVQTPRFGPGKNAHFTIGSGGARVSAKTLSGSIVIAKRRTRRPTRGTHERRPSGPAFAFSGGIAP
jgi:DUF4097 and DUF4098 domain-containing protein YvlB